MTGIDTQIKNQNKNKNKKYCNIVKIKIDPCRQCK